MRGCSTARPVGHLAASAGTSSSTQYYVSATVKAAEDKTFPGAVAAALASPWGQAISAGDPANTYFGSYREVFARDLYEAWTAVFLAGDRETATNMTRFLFERQQLADGSMPRNSLTNGKTAPDSFNTQLDECAYPLVMALAVGLTGKSYYEAHIKPAANFVASHGPSFGPERWEEQGGFSPSTISAEIAGLVAAAIIADRNGDHASADIWRGVADEFQRNLKAWTLTTNGPLARAYFIRLSKNGDPNEDVDYNVGNGGPTLDQREVIDAGFLEYARLGVMSEHDADLVARSRCRPGDPPLTVKRRRVPPLQRRRLRRRRDRRPAVGAERPGQRPPVARARRRARPVRARHRQTRRRARAPRGDERDGLGRRADPRAGLGAPRPRPLAVRHRPTIASIGFFNGKPAGSAAPLTWSAGAVRAADARHRPPAGVLDRPLHTRERYVRHTQGETALTVTAPGDNTSVGGSGDGHGHVGARQPDRRRGDEHRRQHGHHDGHDHGGGRRHVQRRRRAHRRRARCSTSSPQAADRRDRAARSARSCSTSCRARCVLRGRRPGQRRQRARQLRLPDRRATSTPARTTCSSSRCSTTGDRVIFRVRNARPVADLRQPARRAAGRRLRARPGRRRRRRRRRRSRSATTRSRRRRRGAG